MKTTIVIYGSSTGSCQSIAETIASKLGVEAVDVANIDDATIASHENLLLGTSTCCPFRMYHLRCFYRLCKQLLTQK